ncbi:Rpn family recombination-promoting nuclease/putative transposase [Haliangium sp.]|uniref:Rpn family recombination-promoting nuclease/putative transposase n=1 Tax=Haliangium sp. TaxID=2663208 RepID=UPI003D10FD10
MSCLIELSQPRHARSLLRVVLPGPLRELLDRRRLRIENGSFIDERLREQGTDLLIHVQMGGNDSHIHVLLEHQSKPQGPSWTAGTSACWSPRASPTSWAPSPEQLTAAQPPLPVSDLV